MKRNLTLISLLTICACSAGAIATEDSTTGLAEGSTTESSSSESTSESSSTTESSGVDHLDEGLKASGDDAPSLCELLIQCMEDKCLPFNDMCADECALETGADRGECGIVW